MTIKIGNLTPSNHYLGSDEIDKLYHGINLVYEKPPSWLPTNLPNLTGWFDASDASTITESGGRISQWNDKSGLNNNITQSALAKQAEYVTGYVQMRADYIFESPSIPIKEIYMVVSNVESRPYMCASGTTNYLFWNEAGQSYTVSVDGNGGNSGSASINGGTRVSGGNITITDPAGFNTGLPNNSDNIILGVNVDNSFNSQTIASYTSPLKNIYRVKEIVISSTDLTLSERVELESYLATKWGV